VVNSNKGAVHPVRAGYANPKLGSTGEELLAEFNFLRKKNSRLAASGLQNKKETTTVEANTPDLLERSTSERRSALPLQPPPRHRHGARYIAQVNGFQVCWLTRGKAFAKRGSPTASTSEEWRLIMTVGSTSTGSGATAPPFVRRSRLAAASKPICPRESPRWTTLAEPFRYKFVVIQPSNPQLCGDARGYQLE
jgi:hypothetical protein